ISIFFYLFFFFNSLCLISTFTLFPYTTLFRSILALGDIHIELAADILIAVIAVLITPCQHSNGADSRRFLCHQRNGQLSAPLLRSEEHTSELQSRFDLVCRLLLEKKNK